MFYDINIGTTATDGEVGYVIFDADDIYHPVILEQGTVAIDSEGLTDEIFIDFTCIKNIALAYIFKNTNLIMYYDNKTNDEPTYYGFFPYYPYRGSIASYIYYGGTLKFVKRKITTLEEKINNGLGTISKNLLLDYHSKYIARYPVYNTNIYGLKFFTDTYVYDIKPYFANGGVGTWYWKLYSYSGSGSYYTLMDSGNASEGDTVIIDRILKTTDILAIHYNDTANPVSSSTNKMFYASGPNNFYVIATIPNTTHATLMLPENNIIGESKVLVGANVNKCIFDIDITYKIYKNNSTLIMQSYTDACCNALQEQINNISNTQLQATNNILYGKKLSVIGDSMVQGHSIARDQGWVAMIANRNNMTYENLGQNGIRMIHSIYGSGSTYNGVVDQISKVANNANYVLIFAGTNDDSNNITIGDVTSTTNTEFCGAINLIIQALYSKNAKYKIGFITPYNRPNRTTTINYVNAIENVCARWSIPVYNNFKNGGICWANAEQKSALTLGDNLHLNLAGMEYASIKYENFLRSL